MYYLKPDQRGAQRYAMGLGKDDVRHRALNPSISGRRELVLLTEAEHHERHRVPFRPGAQRLSTPPVCSGASPGPSEEVVGPSEAEHRDYCCCIS